MAMVRPPAPAHRRTRRSRRSEAEPHWHGSIHSLPDRDDLVADKASVLVVPGCVGRVPPQGSYNPGMTRWRRQPPVPEVESLVAGHRDPTDGAGLRRGLAVPCFAEDPADLVRLGIGAEQAGLDGYFLWDHLVHSDSGEGPPIVDPWQVLAVVAARTSRIKLGTMITPVARRRPWKLAKEVTTLDLLSGGRVILGVGLGDPARAEFGLFSEPTDRRVRAELLDEGLDVLAGLWTGQPFSHEGKHFTVGPVRFSPSPVQRPRVPIWVGGVLPAGGLLARAARWAAGVHPRSGPVARAARWDGFVPIRPGRPGDRATVGEIAAARDKIAGLRGTTADFDIAVWGELDLPGV